MSEAYKQGKLAGVPDAERGTTIHERFGKESGLLGTFLKIKNGGIGGSIANGVLPAEPVDPIPEKPRRRSR